MSLRPRFALLLLPFAAMAQLTPTGPIENFNLPRFGPTGIKEWQMGGKTALYRTDPANADKKNVLITDLQIVTYDPPKTTGEAPVARQTFTSPLATVYPDEQRADSDDLLKLVGPGYTLTGKKWSWKREGNSSRVEIKSAARLVLGFDLSGTLLPGTALAPNNPNPIIPPARESK